MGKPFLSTGLEHDFVLLDCLYHLVNLFQIHAKRFLAQDVLSISCRPEDLVKMCPMGRTNAHCVHIGIIRYRETISPMLIILAAGGLQVRSNYMFNAMIFGGLFALALLIYVTRVT